MREFFIGVNGAEAEDVIEAAREVNDVTMVLEAIDEAAKAGDVKRVRELSRKLYRIEETIFEALSERFVSVEWLGVTQIGLSGQVKVINLA